MTRQRLQKLIAAAGLCSRRRAEEWLQAGRVTVDGQVARVGDQADPQQQRFMWMVSRCRPVVLRGFC